MTRDLEDIQKYFRIIAELKKDILIYDCHAHPTEIIFNELQYHECRDDHGLMSAADHAYSPPMIDVKSCREIYKTDYLMKNNGACDDNILLRIQKMMLEKLYYHIGPKVFLDHMKLSGVDKVLFLPVATSIGTVERQMEMMHSLYMQYPSFVFGYCVPNDVGIDEISASVDRALRAYRIRALKLHPNITGINPLSRKGMERVEAILTASREFELPLIVHGGRSPLLETEGASEYALIQNLETIDWGITDKTVVIAHAGAYGCGEQEIGETVLPAIIRMLRRYDHLMVDLSELGLPVINYLLDAVDCDRIVFGSDALYDRQWMSIVRLLHALNNRCGKKADESFVRIVSGNPLKYIMKGE